MRELNNGSRNAFARHLASARRWITSCVDRYHAAADYAALSNLSDAELRQRSLSRSSLAHDLTSNAPSQKKGKVGKGDRALLINPLENAKHERNLRTWPLRLAAMCVIFSLTCWVFAYSLYQPRPLTTVYDTFPSTVGP